MHRFARWIAVPTVFAVATATAPAAPAQQQLPYSQADVQFMQGMIAHHAQAVAMTSLVPTHTTNPDLHRLAQRIAISQRDEIKLMQTWLRDHQQPVPAADTLVAQQTAARSMDMPGMSMADSATALMPGMLNPRQMTELAAATGAPFDSLFLRDMIRHHQGALTMVAKLLGTQGSAQESAVFQFASSVDADQRAEIARMTGLLAAGPPSSTHR